MSAPIPIALVERNEQFARVLQEALVPRFLVVHVCLDVETAVFELPNCYAGPAAGSPHRCPIGSNMQVVLDERREPRAVVIGPGFADRDVFAIKDSAERGLPDVVAVKLDQRAEPGEDMSLAIVYVMDTLINLVDDGVLKEE